MQAPIPSLKIIYAQNPRFKYRRRESITELEFRDNLSASVNLGIQRRNLAADTVGVRAMTSSVDSPVLIRRDDKGIFTLTLNAGENRFNPGFIKHLNDALDVVEKSEGPAALVITSSSPKFFSNGLDTTFMAENPGDVPSMLQGYMKFAARLLSLGMPSVSAIGGHVYAAGLMTALACDYRVMRSDRGFACLPEVDIHMALTPGMNSLIAAKITDSRVFRDAVLGGKRYAGSEALSCGIVDFAVSENEVLPKAMAIATSLIGKGEDRTTYGALKSEAYREAIDNLNSGSLGRVAKL